MLGSFKNESEGFKALIGAGFSETKMLTESLDGNKKGFSRKNNFRNPITKSFVDTAVLVVYDDLSSSIIFG